VRNMRLLLREYNLAEFYTKFLDYDDEEDAEGDDALEETDAQGTLR